MVVPVPRTLNGQMKLPLLYKGMHAHQCCSDDAGAESHRNAGEAHGEDDHDVVGTELAALSMGDMPVLEMICSHGAVGPIVWLPARVRDGRGGARDGGMAFDLLPSIDILRNPVSVSAAAESHFDERADTRRGCTR